MVQFQGFRTFRTGVISAPRALADHEISQAPATIVRRLWTPPIEPIGDQRGNRGRLHAFSDALVYGDTASAEAVTFTHNVDLRSHSLNEDCTSQAHAFSYVRRSQGPWRRRRVRGPSDEGVDKAEQGRRGCPSKR